MGQVMGKMEVRCGHTESFDMLVGHPTEMPNSLAYESGVQGQVWFETII